MDELLRIGIDGVSSRGAMPQEYRDHVGAKRRAVTLRNAVSFLEEQFGVKSVPVAYLDPETDEWVRTERHIALTNPAWYDGAAKPKRVKRETACWHVPTNAYTPATPAELYGPLADALDREGYEAFGEIRLYRDGGEIDIDLYVPELSFGGSGDSPALTLGLNTGHDYFGGRTLHASAIAFDAGETGDGDGDGNGDGASSTVMRSISETKKRRHVGSAGVEAVSWWEVMLDRLDAAGDILIESIANAMDWEIPVKDLPVNLTQFYTHLGLPETTLAKAAANRAAKTSRGNYTAWSLHRAGTWAVEHDSDVKTSGSAFRKHVSAVNKLLYAPGVAEQRVIDSARKAAVKRIETSSDTTIGDIRDALDAFDDRRESVVKAAKEYQSTEQRLRDILSDLESADEADETDVVESDESESEAESETETEVEA